MKKALVVVIVIGFLLLSGVSAMTNFAQAQQNSQKFFKPANTPVAYEWHYFTKGDASRMIKISKMLDNSGNLDKIVDGHFTGYKPPSPKSVESMVGNMEVINGVSMPGGIPTHIDLSKDPRFPAVGNQEQQGSCAAWAVTYYNEGWLQAYTHNWTDAHYGYNKHHLMSPAWTYNKVDGGSDSGSSFVGNMRVLYVLGGASLYTMPYNDKDAVSWGDEAAWREAPQYRIADGYIINVSAVSNVTTGTLTPPTSQQVQNLTNVIKSFLLKGEPVNFAIDADEYNDIFQNGNYIISYKAYNPNGTPNHAQTIVGYNDSVSFNGDKGVFKVVNSWGTGWGDQGYYWITYKALYEILAMGKGDPFAFAMQPRVHYQPKILAVWTLDPHYRGTRITPIDLGIGSPSHPIEVEQSVFGNITSANGGDHPFPTFLAVDLTDFMGNVSFNSTNEFFLYAHRWSKKMVIDSFHIEYYKNVYIPGEPYQVSANSPDVPATQSTSQSAIVRAYFRPIQSHSVIKIDSNAGFTAANGVIGGTGTKSDPYIIGWWDINANGSSYSVYIGNTSAYFVIETSYFHNASKAGIRLYNVTNGYIMNSKIYNNKYGVLFTKSYGNTLASNQFYGNGNPIYITTSTNAQYYDQKIYNNNTVRGMPLYYIASQNDVTLKNVNAGYIGVFHSSNINLVNVTINGTDEIYIGHSTNVSLLYSHIVNASNGVLANDSSVKLFGNYFTGNGYGFMGYEIADSVINNNTFSHNGYGIVLIYSTNNTIYHNNFVFNTHQAYDDENNTWSLAPPTGGNYWSDYNGTDADHNGFGDTPYVIPGGTAKDYYPLMNAWDTVPPSVTISSPKNGKILGTSSIHVYWNGTDNIGIGYYQVRLDSGSWINVGDVNTYTFTNVQDGNHTVYVEAVDLSGNTATAEVSFEVDTTPPVITFVSPTENSCVNTSNVMIKWNVHDQTKVTFMITVDNALPYSVGTATEYLAKNLNSGKHTVSLFGMDAAGNSKTINMTFYVDTTPPTVQWNMSISNGAWIHMNTLTLRWIAADNFAVNYSAIKLDNGSWINVGNVESYTLSNLSQGQHIVLLRVYDKAGNFNTTSLLFNVDTQAPNISIISPQNNYITNKENVKIQWKGSDNIAVAYYAIKVDSGEWKNVGTDTSYTVTLQDGHHTIYVKAVDKAGNSKAVTVSITVDTVAPSLQITSPSANANLTSSSVLVTWKGSDNVGISHYEIKIDNGTWVNVGMNTTYNFTKLKDGSHTVYVKAIDKAGNTQTVSITFNIKQKSSGINFGSMTGAIIGISILIIIIIIVIVAVVVTKKKSKSPREMQK